MKHFKNKDGNFEITFISNINIDNGFTNQSIGDKQSSMELFTNDEGEPTFIEWVVNDDDFIESIGIEYDEYEKEVTGYDGVFDLPKEAIQLLELSGFKVSDDLKD